MGITGPADDRGDARARRLQQLARVADWLLILLALAVVPILVLEDSASPSVRAGALLTNWLIWGAFVTDFLLRWAADRFRARYVARAWLDLLIIAVTVPVMADLLRGLLAVRAARLLRLVRVVRIGSVAILAFRRYRDALARRRFHYVTVIAVAVIGLGAFGLYLIEGDQNPSVATVGDAPWWAVVTATTVGYGDISPGTLEGRLIAVVLMLVGIGVIGLFTATIASYMFSSEEGGVSNAELAARLDRIERALEALHAQRAPRDGEPPSSPTNLRD